MSERSRISWAERALRSRKNKVERLASEASALRQSILDVDVKLAAEKSAVRSAETFLRKAIKFCIDDADAQLAQQLGFAPPAWAWAFAVRNLAPTAEALGYELNWDAHAQVVSVIETNTRLSLMRQVGRWAECGWVSKPFIPGVHVSNVEVVCQSIFSAYRKPAPWEDRELLGRVEQAASDPILRRRLVESLPVLVGQTAAQRLRTVAEILAEVSPDSPGPGAWCVRYPTERTRRARLKWFEIPFASRIMAMDYAIELKRLGRTFALVFREPGLWKPARSTEYRDLIGRLEVSDLDDHGRVLLELRDDAGKARRTLYSYAVPQVPSSACWCDHWLGATEEEPTLGYRYAVLEGRWSRSLFSDERPIALGA